MKFGRKIPYFALTSSFLKGLVSMCLKTEVKQETTFLRGLLQKKLHFTWGLETFLLCSDGGKGCRESKSTYGMQEGCAMKSAHLQTRGEILRDFSHLAFVLSHLSQNVFLPFVWPKQRPFPVLAAVSETRSRRIRARNFGCNAFSRRRHFEVFCTIDSIV